VHCPACRADNDERRRFCRACGAALPIPCPACGFGNRPDDAFCGGCGARLDVATATPTAAEAERRSVTVLFADLCGSTDLASRLDPEDFRDLVGRVLDVIDAEIEAHGGTVDKHLGDGAMVLFGAPVAHDDDPLRAVHAAAAIHRRIAALAQDATTPLAVHIGIAVGDVVASGVGRTGHADYTVVGESVNVAARLLELAGPGETLLTDDVRERVQGRVALTEAGSVTPRGLARAMGTWRLGGEVESNTAVSPFVGRSAELGQMRAILDASRAGAGQIVVVRGEAGIGKSRLVERLAEDARARGYAVHKALVLDFGTGKGQDAIRALARGLVGAPAGADRNARAAAADTAQARGWVADVDRPLLDDLLDLGAATGGRTLVEAMDPATRAMRRCGVLTALLRGASAAAPCLIVVEDVHWADGPTLADIAALGAPLGSLPAVLVLTTRLDGDPLTPAWRAGLGTTPLTTLDLRPLGRQEAADLARTIARSNAALVDNCVERAEGNPLFLVQLLHHARDLAGDQVPGSIQSLVLARVDRLAPADRSALQAASILGQRLGLDALRHLAGDPGYDPASLLATGLLRSDGAALMFGHALIRDGVYGSLLRARRRDLHDRAAAWYGDRDAILRAEHLARAGNPEAAGAYLEAAEGEARAARTERVLALAEAGMAVAATEGDRCALALVRGDALIDLGRVAEATDVFGAAPAVGDARLRARRLLGLANARRIADDLEGAFAHLDEAEPIVREAGLMALLARVESLRGNLHFPRGETAACIAAHGRALEAARAAGSVEDEVRALGGLADAAYAEGSMISARRHLERCLDLCAQHGLVRVEAANRPMLAIVLLCDLDFAGAREAAEGAVALARRIGYRRAELIATHGLHLVCFLTGDLDTAEAHAEVAIALARELGSGRFEYEGLAMRADARAMRGDRAAAGADIRAALALGRSAGMAYWGPCVLAKAALLNDDAAEAQGFLDEGEALLDAGSLSHNHIFFAAAAIDAAIGRGAWADAIRFADRLDRYVAREPAGYSSFLIARGRALARWGQGDRSAEARRQLAEVLDQAKASGMAQGRAEIERAMRSWDDDATGPAPRGIGNA
jgi:class 3 adenylate cyclase/tetratricopeptide (TPR) repeat protein